MKVSQVSFKSKFVVPHNEINKEVKYFHNKVLEIGKAEKSTTTVSGDQVVIDAHKSKDDFIRDSLKKIGLQFKEFVK